jgi:hypothetical protein
VLSPPPSSPVLALAGFFLLFSKLNVGIKGGRFETISSIQQTVMRELNAIRKEEFSWAFD